MKVSALKKNVKAGFTLIELMVVIAILASMAVIGGNAYLSHMKDGDRQVAQSNLQSVHKILGQFKADQTCYPCDSTAEKLQEEKPDLNFGELTGEYSNNYFRQVFYSAANESEKPFFAKLAVAGKATKEADERVANGAALSKGENGMSYVLRKSTDDPNRKEAVTRLNAPLAFCSLYPSDTPYSGDNMVFDMSSYDGQALVLFSDGSVKNLKDSLEEDDADEAKGTLQKGKDVFPATKKGRDIAGDYYVLTPDL
ncbi:MAG: type II secretion system protein [Akkermansia sp.]|nr:type II secretion system protein [Akkermansia sp.]